MCFCAQERKFAVFEQRHHTTKQNVDVQLGERFLEVIVHSLDAQHLKKAKVTVHHLPVAKPKGNKPDR